jgi:hypothetical protein
VLPHHGKAKPIGTIFTLLIVPSLYMLIAKEHKKPPDFHF